jgi:hypothetical protein
MPGPQGGVYKLIGTASTKLDNYLNNYDLLLWNYNNLWKLRRDERIRDRNMRIHAGKWTPKNEEDYMTRLPMEGPIMKDLMKDHRYPIVTTYRPNIPIASNYSRCEATGSNIPGGRIEFNIGKDADYISDMVLHYKFSSFNAVDPNDSVRYCKFPGHRLIDNAEMLLTPGTPPIDQFNSEDLNVHYQHKVKKTRKEAWKKLVGEDCGVLGFQRPYANAPLLIEHRIMMGAQVPKNIQPELDMYIPFIFWFNDYKNALSTIQFSPDSTKVIVTLAPAIKMYECIGTGSLAFISPRVLECELLFNGIYVPTIFHSLIVGREVNKVIRVHRQIRRIINLQRDNIQLREITLPLECIYINVRPAINDTYLEHWHENHLFTDISIHYPSYTNTPIPVLSDAPIIVPTINKVVDSLRVHVQDIELSPNCHSAFYDSYLPLVAKSNNEQFGSMMVPFSLEHNPKYPMGYLNMPPDNDISIDISLMPGVGVCNVFITLQHLQLIRIIDGTVVAQLLK